MTSTKADHARATMHTAAVIADRSASLMDRYHAAQAEEAACEAARKARGRAGNRGGCVMATSAQRIADLEQQAADLATRLERVEDYGLAIKALLEAVLDESLGRPGSVAGVRAGLKAVRSRHLVALQGGEQ